MSTRQADLGSSPGGRVDLFNLDPNGVYKYDPRTEQYEQVQGINPDDVQQDLRVPYLTGIDLDILRRADRMASSPLVQTRAALLRLMDPEEESDIRRLIEGVYGEKLRSPEVEAIIQLLQDEKAIEDIDPDLDPNIQVVMEDIQERLAVAASLRVPTVHEYSPLNVTIADPVGVFPRKKRTENMLPEIVAQESTPPQEVPPELSDAELAALDEKVNGNV
jgi:hypothetical protein